MKYGWHLFIGLALIIVAMIAIIHHGYVVGVVGLEVGLVLWGYGFIKQEGGAPITLSKSFGGLRYLSNYTWRVLSINVGAKKNFIQIAEIRDQSDIRFVNVETANNPEIKVGGDLVFLSSKKGKKKYLAIIPITPTK